MKNCKDVKVKKKKVVFKDPGNPTTKKISVSRKRDTDGDVKIIITDVDSVQGLFWLTGIQIDKMIETLEEARDSAKAKRF